MMRILKLISAVALCAALFISGFCAGICVKVFIERGAPVIHGGGELVLLLAIPASIVVGYVIGRKKKETEGDGQ